MSILNSGGAKSMSFHLFRNLPTEIQDHIWDLAIRPLPGNRHVHEFIVVDHYFDKPNGADKICADFLRFEPGGYLGQNFGLAVPRNDPVRGPNMSAYSLDSGLWMACQQSRRALERYYRKNEWWSDLSNPECPTRLAGRGDYSGQSGVSHTASYIDGDGRAHHVTISPDKDLVHLVGLDPVSVEWFYHYAGDRFLINYRCRYEPYPSFLGLDIAITFDHRWVGFIPSTLVDMIHVLHDDSGRTLWFIDQRLHRVHASESGGIGLSGTDRGSDSCLKNNNRQVFYSSGYVFTEVRETDEHLWEVKDEENRTRSVFEFFRLLIPMHNGRLEIEGSDRMRVLACEVSP